MSQPFAVTVPANEASLQKDNIFFYLDAHWYNYLPLNNELEIIFSSWNSPIVMIDDFEVPNTDYQFDDYGDIGRINLDYIAPTVDKHKLSTFFPGKDPEYETGSKRGSVVLCDLSTARKIKSHITSLTLYMK